MMYISVNMYAFSWLLDIFSMLLVACKRIYLYARVFTCMPAVGYLQAGRWLCLNLSSCILVIGYLHAVSWKLATNGNSWPNERMVVWKYTKYVDNGMGLFVVSFFSGLGCHSLICKCQFRLCKTKFVGYNGGDTKLFCLHFLNIRAPGQKNSERIIS